MRNLISMGIYILLPILLLSQNLVQNHNFQDVDSLTGQPKNFYGRFEFFRTSQGDVPVNNLGEQAPVDGDNYVAMNMWSLKPNPTAYTAMLIGEVKPGITSGSQIIMTFEVSLCDESPFASGGWYALWSDSMIDTTQLPTTVPDKSNMLVVTDTLNWTTIHIIDTAQAQVNYFAIYSYNNSDSFAQTEAGGTYPGGSIYYLDDICVSAGDNCSTITSVPPPIPSPLPPPYRATDLLGREVPLSTPGIQIRWYKSPDGRQFWIKQVVR